MLIMYGTQQARRDESTKSLLFGSSEPMSHVCAMLKSVVPSVRYRHTHTVELLSRDLETSCNAACTTIIVCFFCGAGSHPVESRNGETVSLEFPHARWTPVGPPSGNSETASGVGRFSFHFFFLVDPCGARLTTQPLPPCKSVASGKLRLCGATQQRKKQRVG